MIGTYKIHILGGEVKSNIFNKFSNFATGASLEGNCANLIFSINSRRSLFPPVPYAIFNHTYVCEILCVVEELQPWRKIAVIDIIL